MGGTKEGVEELARGRMYTGLQGGIYTLNISVEGTAIPSAELNSVKLGIMFRYHKAKRLLNRKTARKNRAASFSLGGGRSFWWISSDFMRPRSAYSQPSQGMWVLGWECSCS